MIDTTWGLIDNIDLDPAINRYSLIDNQQKIKLLDGPSYMTYHLLIMIRFMICHILNSQILNHKTRYG